MSRRSRQRRDKRAECHLRNVPDEAALSRLWANGAEAWRTVPDAAAWVDELRGNTMTTDQFQPLRDALAVWPLSTPPVIRQEPPDGCMVWLSDDDAVTVADALAPEWAALIVAAVNAAPALLAEVERLTAELAAARVNAKTWRDLYRRAVNEANGLTNYMEDRPELRRAERNLTAIEADARAAAARTAGDAPTTTTKE